MRARCVLVAVPALLALSGCATVADRSCGAGLQPMVDARVYFGAQRPRGGEVTDAEWARFVEDTVAPAFPDGFSTWEAQGAWRGADGVLVREGSHVLSVVLPAGAPSAARVKAVADAYQARFEQEAVLRVVSDACVGP